MSPLDSIFFHAAPKARPHLIEWSAHKFARAIPWCLTQRREAGGSPEKDTTVSKSFRAVPVGRPPAQAGTARKFRPRAAIKAPRIAEQPPRIVGQPLKPQRSKRTLPSAGPLLQSGKEDFKCRSFPARCCEAGGNLPAASAAMPHAAAQRVAAQRRQPHFFNLSLPSRWDGPLRKQGSAAISAHAAGRPLASPLASPNSRRALSDRR